MAIPSPQHKEVSVCHVYCMMEKKINGFAEIIANKDLDIVKANNVFLRAFGVGALLEKIGLTMLVCDTCRASILEKIKDECESFVIECKNKKISMQFERLNVFNKDKEARFAIILNCIEENLEEKRLERVDKVIWDTIDGGVKVCKCDEKYTFLEVGKELLSFFEYDYSEFIEKTNNCMYDMVYEEDRKEIFSLMNEWFITGDYYEVEYRIRKKDGRVVWVSDKGNRFVDENGNIVCIGMIIDIDSEKKIIEKIVDSNRELKKLQNSIPGSFGKVALLEDYMYLLSGNEKIYDEMQVDKNTYEKKIYYDKIGITKFKIVDVLENKRENFLLEYENDAYLTSRNYVITGTRYDREMYKEKYPIYFIVTMDITAQKESKEQAYLQQEKYKIISDISEDIIFEYDCLLDCIEYSENYRNIFGKNPIINNLRVDMLNGEKNPNNIKLEFADIFDVVESGEKRYEKEVNLKIKDDSYKWFSITATGMKNKDGDLIRVIGMLRDIDKQKREQKKLFDKSRIDSMTGLLNKVATEEEITNKLYELQEDSYGVLMMIDIDKFKEVNDVFGHMVGDMVIKKIATKLKTVFRSEDVIGRIGGDEFQVYMTNVLEKDVVREKAEHFNLYVKTMFVGTEVDEHISVSIGVAFAETKDTVYKELYQKADIALYNAKENGKDRYEIYGENREIVKSVNKKQLPNKEFAGVNYNIVTHIVDILLTNGYIENNIRNVLDYVAYMIGVDRIIAYSICDEKAALKLEYEWHKKENTSNKYMYVVNDKIFNYVIIKKGEMSDVRYCSDISELPSQERVYFAQRDIVSVLQCDVMDRKKTIGYIEFIKEREKKIWNKQEIGILQIVAKILSNTVVKEDVSISIKKNSTKEREMKFSLALKDECTQIMDIDAYTGAFDLFIPCKDGFSKYADRSNYDDWLVEKVIPYVEQEYCEQFMNTFLLESMLRRFATGIKKIEMEFKKNLGENSFKWCKQFALLKYDSDGKKSIIVFVKDITEEKVMVEESEFMSWQIRKQNLVLRKLCEGVIEVDFERKETKVVFEKNNTLCTNMKGDVFKNLARYLGRYLSEKDRKSLEEKLSYDYIRSCIEMNMPVSVFSYKMKNSSEIMEILISKMKNEYNKKALVTFRKK